MANNLKKAIGNGVSFPIILSNLLDENGDPKKVYAEGGGLVDSIAWDIKRGDPDLIRQNLTQVFSTLIGSMMRREDFGSRIFDMIEEPNNQLLTFKASTYITEAIAKWETRVTLKKIYLSREFSSLAIRMVITIANTNSDYDLDFTYNLNQ